MVDALKEMIDAGELAGSPFPMEFYELYMKLNRIGPHLRVEDFSRIFSETVTPTGQEPVVTKLYYTIKMAKQSPQDPICAGVLDFVEKTRKIIQLFDFNKARNTSQVSIILLEMQTFVRNMLDEIHARALQLNANGREALHNMERWKSSLRHLDPHRLTLNKLNDFVRNLQPTQPFGLSVYYLYQQLTDEMAARAKAMEFMGLVTGLSNLINPFTQELAANEELTGWQYLHVPPPAPVP
jgi:hypothetical protein